MAVIRSSLVPADEVRARFGNISKSTLYRWQKRGEIPRPIQIGKKLFFDDREIGEHIEALKKARITEGSR